MENNAHIKCASKKHQELNATSYCQDCRLYMCEKCLQIHQDLYNHSQININENQTEIFTGICKEKNHINNLDFFCKTHNKLCCLACISNINKNGYGQHKNCDICIIEDIQEEKKAKFKENIKEFENLSNSVTQSINQLKKTYDEINNKKEEMKIVIQKLFTKLRNELNIREENLLKKIDEKFDNSFIKEENIRQYEKLPKQIQKLLDEINLVNKEWKVENLNYYLNCCSNIETNINKIKDENESLQKWINAKIYKIDYSPKEEQINEILEKIKSLGDIYYEFEFVPCKNEINETPEYAISGEKENIITKLSKQNWTRILSKNILENNKEYNYKIKIIKSKSKQIMIGLAQIIPEYINKDFMNSIKNGLNINVLLKKKSLLYYLFHKMDKIDIFLNYGWYFSFNDSSLFSDAPQNYRNNTINYLLGDEIKININMQNGTFSLYSNDSENKKVLYKDIPLNKPMSLSVLLYDEEDSIEILPF